MTTDAPAPPPQIPAPDAKTWTLLCYACALLGFGLIGLIIAYVKKADLRGTIWESHLEFYIRTCWLGLAGMMVGFVSMASPMAFLFFLIAAPFGFLIFSALMVWFYVRIVIGLIKAASDKPIDNPYAWLL